MIQHPLAALYTRLYDHYGPQHWWPADTPFEIVVGAVLTQATAWRNVERAIARLKERGLLEPSAMQQASVADLEDAIRPAGYFRAKARTLRGVLKLIEDRYGGSLDRMLQAPGPMLREQLLGVRGIGPETADAILLYAAGHPVFVVDAYTVRIVSRAGLVPAGELSYERLQDAFQRQLPRDPGLYGEYHALLVALGKDCCRKQNPRCRACPAVDMCAFGRQTAAALSLAARN
ncbi:MAG: hypothetical protein BAA04_02920 [Firmicutes bacterium ZCTH02-B6]|nr:MAG: hypothetical protein BAA04_02920 [Firmicutes bacterium ZCTH02-B6]